MNTIKKYIVPGAVATAALVGFGGGSILNSLSASAATTTPTTQSTTSTGATFTTGASEQPSMPAHGSAAHEANETPVTGSTATQVQTAAVKYVGGGTAGSVTNDYTHTGYEVTVTKTDGTTEELHLDGSFNVMTGGPGGH